jgi:transcriptional regulator with XRE-family HTH domain
MNFDTFPHMQTEYAKIFGQNLRRARLARGLSIPELAEKTGLDPVTIRRVEDGEQFPRPKNIKLLADGVGISDPNDLLVGMHALPQSGVQPINPESLFGKMIAEAHQELGVYKQELAKCKERVKELEAELAKRK